MRSGTEPGTAGSPGRLGRAWPCRRSSSWLLASCSFSKAMSCIRRALQPAAKHPLGIAARSCSGWRWRPMRTGDRRDHRIYRDHRIVGACLLATGRCRRGSRRRKCCWHGIWPPAGGVSRTGSAGSGRISSEGALGSSRIASDPKSPAAHGPGRAAAASARRRARALSVAECSRGARRRSRWRRGERFVEAGAGLGPRSSVRGGGAHA